MSEQLSQTSVTAAIVAIGGFIFGFDAAVISGVVGPVSQEWVLDSWSQGMVVAAPTLASIVAGFFVGPTADFFGRRRVLFVMATLFLISAIGSAFAGSAAMLIIARFVGGFAFGSLMLAPIYIAEIAPESERGRLVSFNQLNIVVGFSAAYFSNYFLLQLLPEGTNWRVMLGIEALPALVWLILLTRIPESPRWLQINGRSDDALKAWRRLGQSPAEMEAEAQSASAPINERIRQLFHPRLRLPIAIGIVVGVAQQATGVNAIYFYAPTIFEQSGVGTNAAFAQATLVGITNVIFTIISMVMIDRLGRKPLLLIGCAGIALSTGLTALCFHQADYVLTNVAVASLDPAIATALQPMVDQIYPSDQSFKQTASALLPPATWLQHEAAIIAAAAQINAMLVLIGILGFVASFAISLGPVMWVLFAEIFPNHIRGFAVAFVGFFNGMTSFGVQFIFPWELQQFGAAPTFAIYAVIAVIAAIICWRILPETKQRTLEELEALLANRKTPGAAGATS